MKKTFYESAIYYPFNKIMREKSKKKQADILKEDAMCNEEIIKENEMYVESENELDKRKKTDRKRKGV